MITAKEARTNRESGYYEELQRLSDRIEVASKSCSSVVFKTLPEYINDISVELNSKGFTVTKKTNEFILISW